MLPPDLTLTCPQCQYTAPASAFAPPKLTSQFAERAFVLLTVVSMLAVLRGLGVIK